MLTGTALLTKVKDLGDCPKDELVLACGFKTPAGKPAYPLFYEALLQAKGIELAPPSTATKGRGKAPSYEATIAKTGTLPIGGAYTQQAGWNPGDKVRISVDGARITLERSAVASEAPSGACEMPAACLAPVPAAGAPEAALAAA